MKKTIFILSVLAMCLCAGCGSDEPEDAKPITCKVRYTDNIYGDANINAQFYLFPGTNIKDIDKDSFSGLMGVTTLEAVTTSGTRVKNVGWCTATNKQMGTIVPRYSDTEDTFNAIRKGDFTIVCISSYPSTTTAYMMKTFSKRTDELISVEAHFVYSDFAGSFGQWNKVNWR